MRHLRLPQLQNVGPNQRVSLRLPLGQTYEKLYLFLQGNIVATLITNIVLRINNKEMWRWASYADMAAYNGYRGNFLNTGVLFFDFTEAKAREEVGMKFGTVAATQEAGVQDFTLEFDLGNYTNTAASIIQAWADVEAPSANRVITRVQYSQKVIAAAAEETVYIPFGASGFQLKRVHIKHTALSEVRVRRDGVDIYDALPVAFANQRLQDFGRVPQAGYHVIDFMPDSLIANALNTAKLLSADGKTAVPVQNLEFRVKTSGADTLTFYVESFSDSGAL